MVSACLLLRKGMIAVIDTHILHPEGKWEGDHGFCPSPSEEWRSVIMATPIPLLEGRREGGHGLCLSLPGMWLS